MQNHWSKVFDFILNLGGSPDLVIMEGDSCSKGHGFESQHRLLDGHFHIYLLKNVVFV